MTDRCLHCVISDLLKASGCLKGRDSGDVIRSFLELAMDQVAVVVADGADDAPETISLVGQRVVHDLCAIIDGTYKAGGAGGALH